MESHTFENKVGIEQYLRDHSGFFGIIKQRFSDFIVNEISLDETRIQLTSKEIINPPVKEILEDIQCPEELTEKHLEILKVISGLKDVKQLKPSIFYDKTSGNIDPIEENYTELLVNVDDFDKETRTKIHKYVKSQFKHISSSTITKNVDDSGECKFIRVTRNEFAKSSDKKRDTWTPSIAHVHFTLYKEFIDTMDAINLFARKMRMKSNSFSYAGTKDKRAKTTQQVSVYKVKPERLVSIANILRGIHIGNFSFSHKPKRLGELWGNHFKIVLREVVVDEEIINTAIDHLKETGFINYFGMQRFGSTDIPTHLIGKALLLSQWKEAVDLLLTLHKADTMEIANAKRIWRNTKCAKSALDALKFSKFSSEGCLLSGLIRYGATNYLSAIEMISRNMKLMYLHAYQSYAWNKVISKRILKYGIKVLKGDLIRIKKEVTSLPEGDSIAADTLPEEVAEEDEDKNSKYTFISSEEEAESCDLTQVVVPLPGHNVLFPENEMKSWFEDLFKEDGLTFDNLNHKVKAFSLGGAYRHMICLPKSVSSKTCFYNDKTEPLVSSDLDLLKNDHVENNQLSVGDYKAVILEMSLPSSSYATMALRELTRMDTSSEFQSTLNKPADLKRPNSDVEIQQTEKKLKTC